MSRKARGRETETNRFSLDSALRHKNAQKAAYRRLPLAEKMHILDELHDNMVWMMNKVRPLLDGEVFYYAHLVPERTGLRQVIWVPDPLAKDDHLRVQVRSGRAARPNNAILVSIKRPRTVGLSETDSDRVLKFIRLNRAALVAHRNGDIDSFQLYLRLKKI